MAEWPKGLEIVFRDVWQLTLSSSAGFRVMERAFCTVVFQKRRKAGKLIRRPQDSPHLVEKAQKFFQGDLYLNSGATRRHEMGCGNEKYFSTSIGLKVSGL